jgi:hypothetical protein
LAGKIHIYYIRSFIAMSGGESIPEVAGGVPRGPVRPVPDDPEGRTYAQAIAAKLAEKALAGDARAAGQLADRAEGRVRQSPPEDDDDGKMTITIRRVGTWNECESSAPDYGFNLTGVFAASSTLNASPVRVLKM